MAITARNIDIVTVGEVLIDLTQTGVDERGVRTLAANPGGAPANVAVAASRLGTKTAFVGCIGTDAFGDSLRETLEKDGVDTTGLIAHETIPTTLAVVTVNPDGERSFTFYRRTRRPPAPSSRTTRTTGPRCGRPKRRPSSGCARRSTWSTF